MFDFKDKTFVITGGSQGIGYEVAKGIRKFNKDVIIIAQTAYALEGDREKTIKAGCSDYISKPINKNKLLIASTLQLPL